jgi:RHS repeat-associated protein
MLLDSLYYGYDQAGNRIQVGNATTAPKNYAVNDLNQLMSEGDHGRTTFAGTVDEAATVKVNGKSAKVTSMDGGAPFKFEAIVELDAGANAVVVEARDGQNNVATKTYTVTTTGTSKTYEYDANGNLRYQKQPNGTVIREYRWDQQNRLVRVLEGTHESVYEYDGASRRVRIKELESSVETKNEVFIWCGSRICQKRASNGTTVVRSYFKQGFEESGPTNYFYTRDHLGSVREVVGGDGTTVASRLSYDPWGSVTESGSGAKSDFTYTGHHYDRLRGIVLAKYRAYDPGLGRWNSRDPMGIWGGLNLYVYVENNPVNARDASGLTGVFVWGAWGAAMPGPVRPGVEYVALAGLDTDVSGYGYTGNITAAGVEMGSEAEGAAAFYGIERTSDGHETPIQLFEAHLGIEVPFIAGITETAGIFNTNDSFGWYFGPSVAALGDHANVGFGISISKSWLPDWLTGGLCH